MMLKLVLVVQLLAITGYESISVEQTDIELLQVLFRHGDRTPITTYPNNPYKEDIWDKYGGLGQLTQTGMNQVYAFGDSIRTRYSEFLSESYDRRRVVVKSTDYDRTIMSAQVFLSALYEPIGYQAWNDKIAWQPIPIHVNNTLFGELKCPRVDEIVDEYTQSGDYKSVEARYKDLFELINANTGQNDTSLKTIGPICDNTFIQKAHKLALPDWLNQNYDRLLEIMDHGTASYKCPGMAKLTTGALLSEIRSNMIDRTKGLGELEMAIFAGHDSTVASLSQLFSKSFPSKQPPYVASFIIELRKAKDPVTSATDYFVQVYYKNNTAEESVSFNLVQVDGCDTLCPLSKFLDLTKDNVITDFSEPCKATKSKSKPTKSKKYSDLTFLISLAFLLFTVVVSIMFAVSSCRYIVRNRISFRRLATDDYKFERINLTVGDIADDNVDDDDDEDVFNKAQTSSSNVAGLSKKTPSK